MTPTAVAVTNHNLAMATMTFARRGQILITSGEDGRVRERDAATRHEIGSPFVLVHNPTYLGGPPGPSVPTMAFSPLGDMTATEGADAEVHLWNLASRHEIGAPIRGGGGGGMTPLLFSPDGRTLAITGNGGTVLLLDGRYPRHRGYRRDHAPVGSTRLPADRVIHPRRGNQPRSYEKVAFSPDGKLIATAEQDGTIRHWNVVSHRQVGRAIPDPEVADMLAFTPNGRVLAAGEGDGKVRLWSITTQRQISRPIAASGNNGLASMAFSPSGTILAAGEQNGKVRLWSVATRQPIGPPLAGVSGGTYQKAAVNSVAFTPDGQLLACSWPRDAKTGRSSCTAWSPTGRSARP